MPLLKEAHDEPGEHYIVHVGNAEFKDRRLGVQFIGGEGRTVDREKAIEFTNFYQYEVQGYEGFKRWDVPVPTDGEAQRKPRWAQEGPVPGIPIEHRAAKKAA